MFKEKVKMADQCDATVVRNAAMKEELLQQKYRKSAKLVARVR